MKIESLAVTNFKKHRSLNLGFGSQATLIVGPNYSGKSSALEAILYALFGPSAVPGGAKIVRTRGSRAKPKVALVLREGKKQYTLSRAGSSARIEVLEEGSSEPTLLASGQASVTKEMEHLLGMPLKTFLLLRVAPQDDAKVILTLGSERLGKVVSEITQADVIDRVIEKASARMPDIPEPVDEEELLKLTARSEALAKTLTEKSTTLSSLAKEVEQLKVSAMKARSESDRIQERYQMAAEIQQDIANKEGQMRNVKDSLIRVEAELSKLEIVTGSALAEANKEYEEARGLAESANSKARELENLKAQEQAKQAEVTSLESSLAELPEFSTQVLEETRTEIEVLIGDIHKIKTEESDRLSKVARLQEELASGVCSECGRPFDEARDFGAVKQEIHELRDEAGKLCMKQAKKAEVLTDLRRGEEHISQLQISHARIEAELSSAKESLEMLQSTRAKLESEIEDLDLKALQEKTAATKTRWEYLSSTAVARSTLENEKSGMNSQLRILDEELALLRAEPGSDVTAEQAEAARNAALEAYNKLQTKESLHRSKSAEYTAEYETYQSLCHSADALKKKEIEYQQAVKTSTGLTELKRYLRKNRDRYLSSAWEQILFTASEFSALCTEGAIKSISRSDSGEFLFDEGNGPQPVVSASGFQKAVMGVGVRLALAQSLRTSAEFMLLDEVTAGATEDRSLAVSRALAASGLQTISVSHRHSDAAAAETIHQLG